MLQGSLLCEEPWDEFSESLPDCGMWDAGAVYGLLSSGPLTNANGFSSSDTTWNTPGTGDHKDDGPTVLNRYARGEAMTCDMRLRISAAQKVRDPSNLVIQALMWPTACQEDGESCGNHPGAVDSLTGAAKLWPTPNTAIHGPDLARANGERKGTGGNDLETTASRLWQTPHGMSNRDANGKVGGCGGGEFALQANQWQTPATDSFRSRGGDRKDEMGLDQQARMFPSPSQRDYRTPNAKAGPDRGMGAKGEQLPNFVRHHFERRQDPQTHDGPASSPNTPTSRRRLNPRFVEWLMMLPIGWTEL